MEKIKLYGVDVYTSEELQEKFKNFINKHGPPVAKDLLINLVDEKVLIPIINEPSKLKQLIMKIRRRKPMMVLGTAVPKTGVAYVIYHKSFSPQHIVDVAFHEVIHIAYIQFPKEFNAINMPLYIRFYSYYYKEYFEANGYDKKMFAKFLGEIVGRSTITYNRTFRGLLGSAFKDYTRLPEEKFSHRIELLIAVMDQYQSDLTQLDYYNLALALLRKTYRHLFKGMDYTSGPVQEIWSPSEIIAILSTIKPNHPNVIKSLKLIKPGKKPVIKDLARKIVK